MAEFNWIHNILNDNEISENDIKEGFPLLQVLSLLSPASVDLNWYTTSDALECPNIALRNYVAIKKGLSYIRENPPSNLLQSSNHNPEILGIKLQKLHHEIDTSAIPLIEEAKSGQAVACISMANSLHTIWTLCQSNEKDLIESEIIINNKSKNTSISAAYEPIERTFRPMIRWLLHTLLEYMNDSNFSQQLYKELEKELDQCSDTESVYLPLSTISMICQGHLYNFLNFFMLQGESFFFPESFQKTANPKEKAPTIFLDNLIELGLLKINQNIFTSIKDMVSDESPFHESVHINIISAFMQSQISNLKLEPTVDYLEKIFPSFDRSLTYPYDIEDALLLWINQCLITVKVKNLVPVEDSAIELEDLISDADDAWMIALVIFHYFPSSFQSHQETLKKLVCKKNVSVEERQQNFKILHDMLSKQIIPIFLPWLPVDMIYQTTGPEKKSAYSGNASIILLHFLGMLMQYVLKNQLLFPSEFTEDRAEEENSMPSSQTAVKHEYNDNDNDNEEDFFKTQTVESSPPIVENLNYNEMTILEIEQEQTEQAIENQNCNDKNSMNELQAPSQGLAESCDPGENSTDEKVNQEEKTEKDSKKVQECSFYEDEVVKTLEKAIETLHSPYSRIPSLNKNPVLPIISSHRTSDNSIEKNSNIDAEDILLFTEKAKKGKRDARIRKPRRSLPGSKVILEPIPEPIHVLSVNSSSNPSYILSDIPPVTMLKELETFPPHPSSVPKSTFDSAIDLHQEKEENIENVLRAVGVFENEEPVVVESHFELQSVNNQHEITHFNDQEGGLQDLDEKSEYVPRSDDNILISNQALQMLLEEEDEVSEASRNDSPPHFTQPAHEDTDNESDNDEIDQDTIDMINQIKKMGLKIEEREEEDDKLDVQVEAVSRQMTQVDDDTASDVEIEVVREQVFTRIPPTNEIISKNIEMDILDFYEADEIVHVSPSRPKTGLMNYPIPEIEGDREGNFFDAPLSEKGEDAWKSAQEKSLIVADASDNHQSAQSSETTPSGVYSKKSSLETLLEMKEERQRKQYESKVKKVQELREKRKKQVEMQKKIIAEKELRRSILKNGLAEPNSPGGTTPGSNQIAPAAGPRRKTPPSKKRTLSTKSNKNLIKNALMHVSLAGSLNKGIKDEVLQDLAESDAGHFVILFRDANNFTFRGLYFWDHELDQTLKLYPGCQGPTELDARAVIEFYKYDSGARTFKPIPTKSFGRSIDAIAIGREYFLPKFSV